MVCRKRTRNSHRAKQKTRSRTSTRCKGMALCRRKWQQYGIYEMDIIHCEGYLRRVHPLSCVTSVHLVIGTVVAVLSTQSQTVEERFKGMRQGQQGLAPWCLQCLNNHKRNSEDKRLSTVDTDLQAIFTKPGQWPARSMRALKSQLPAQVCICFQYTQLFNVPCMECTSNRALCNCLLRPGIPEAYYA